GQAAQVARALSEVGAHFDTGEGAGQPTRYRYHLIRALGDWESGVDPRNGLEATLVSDAAADTETGNRIDVLSATLALAEYLAGRAPEDHSRAIVLGGEALDVANDVRDRWRVIARSRAPL